MAISELGYCILYLSLFSFCITDYSYTLFLKIQLHFKVTIDYKVLYKEFNNVFTGLNFHHHLSTIDETRLDWILRVRVTRMWVIVSNAGVVVRHNIIILDCEVKSIKQ